MSGKAIIEAVREILKHLPALLGEDYGGVEQELKILLRQAESGEPIEQPVRRLLRQHESTRQWMEERLKGISSIERDKGYSPLPGDHTPPPVDNEGDPKPK